MQCFLEVFHWTIRVQKTVVFVCHAGDVLAVQAFGCACLLLFCVLLCCSKSPLPDVAALARRRRVCVHRLRVEEIFL